MNLETVYLLDQIQKGKTISDSDLHLLQEQKLIRTEDQQIYLNDGGQVTDQGTENGTKNGTEDSADTENGIKTDTEDSAGTENGIKKLTQKIPQAQKMA